VSGNNTPWNNHTNVGGGIDNYGTLTITNSTLSSNIAIDGGGITNQTGCLLTVTNCTLSNNTANPTGGPGGGGGIDNYGTLTVNGGSVLSRNKAYVGGGIFNRGGVLTVTDSTLSGNTAANVGGGIDNVGSATLSGCTLSGNTAVSTVPIPGGPRTLGIGGAIYVGAGSLTVSGCTISGNVASQGGGIGNGYGSFFGTVTVKNASSITGNTAPPGFGADVDNPGVLYLDSTSTIAILDGNPAIPI
jgi:hypothetical protein